MVILSDYWSTLQISLIPFMEQVVETRLTEKEKRIVAIVDIISVEKHLDHTHLITVAVENGTIFAQLAEGS